MPLRGKTAPDADIASLFLSGSGRIGKVLERVRLARGARLHVGRLAALATALTWAPLLVLAAAAPVLGVTVRRFLVG